jgi:3-hydroxyacyl-CoA dehydrogenase/enoyl-CoA hydratase/carnithine racemase
MTPAGAGSPERVTRALVRDVELPDGAGTLALVTLDNGLDATKPTTLGPRGLAEIERALRGLAVRAEAGEVAAVAVTGSPPVFAAGADLGVVAGLTDRAEARAVAELGHAALRLLGEMPVPTFAFVNGAAIGGGLELALHCTYRTVAGDVRALALPETRLGLVPGWGGCYLLPRLVGVSAALDVILRRALAGRMTTAQEALAMGLVDRVVAPDRLLEESVAFVAEVLGGLAVPRRPLDDAETWARAVADARADLTRRLHGAARAPEWALDLVAAARDATPDEAYGAEDEALTELLVSPELEAGLYAQRITTRAARRRPVEGGATREVRAVGVVGGGLMASQLAVLFAHRLGVPVAMREVDDERAAAGRERVRAEIAGLVRAGRLDETGADRLAASVTIGTDLSALAGADLVIEAVTEVMAVKQRVFAEVEELVPDDAVLATNTSALSVTQMGAALRHPERVVGLHFFNPVARMPLLEVVHTDATDAVTRATAFELASRLGKSPVAVRDRPGFVVNRLLLKLLGDVLACVEDGTPVAVADVALHPLGLPMSPFTLLQLVGPQVAAHVLGTLHEGLGERYRLSPGLDRLAATGRPLMTRGPDGEDVPEAWVQEAFDEAAGRAPGTVPADAPDAQGVLEAVLAGLTKEIGELLDEQVVAGPEDVDVCMILGAGWPPHLGGITPYLDRTGWSTRLLGRRFRPVAG